MGTCSSDDKKPHPAVTVKMFKSLDYDAGKMLEWAIEHKHGQVLKLDARAFKKLANALPIPGVEYSEVPRPAIARDLSKYEVACTTFCPGGGSIERREGNYERARNT